MCLIIIFGPPAAGKMAVGMELTKIVDLKLFHNHMTIEPLIRIFKHGTTQFRTLDKEFRFRIFEEFAKSDLNGLIFTFVWALELEADLLYVKEIINIFKTQNRKIFFVELEADLNERLRRNKTPLRLSEKESKKNIEWSDKSVVEMNEKYILNTNENLQFLLPEYPYLKIENTNLCEKEVAKLIMDHFKL